MDNVIQFPRPEELEPHPIAVLFPPLSPEQSRELANDIRQKGLLNDIWLYEDALNGGEKKPYILDGRSRNEACVIEGVEPRYKVYDGTDPLGFAVSLNDRRRHMSIADRKLLAERIVKYDPTVTDRELGRKASISHGTAAKVRRAAAANGENVHKDSEGPGSSPEQAPHIAEGGEPTGVSDAAPPAPPPPRIEAGGRKARGRKPSTAPKAAEAKKEVKPKVIDNPRDVYVVQTSALLKADPADILHVWVSAATDDSARICAKISMHTRLELMEKFAIALGIPDEPTAA